MKKNREQQLKDFIKNFQLPDVSIDLLDQALTHKSYANESQHGYRNKLKNNLHNQRLEFLGDTILGTVIALAICRQCEECDEGGLTKKKSRIVCEATLAEIGDSMNLSELLLLGKGEKDTGGSRRKSNIADAVESVLGAIFLDCGYEMTENFILKYWEPYIEGEAVVSDSIDYKSHLQEWLIKKKKIRPEYKVISTAGPEHNKDYEIGLYVNHNLCTTGKAKSRKKGEQIAAQKYIKKFKIQVFTS